MPTTIPRCTSIDRDNRPCGARLIAVPYIDRQSSERHFALLCPTHDRVDLIPSLTGKVSTEANRGGSNGK